MLKPDLVLTFSDLQADIVADLIRRGLYVHAFNQRTVAGILEMIRMLGAMVDANERARQLVETLETRLAEVRSRSARLPKRPRVFFEEWDGPLISGIGWVSELVEIAGGIDIFADRRNQSEAKDRIVTVEEVVAREPDLIIGSWCGGKKFRPEPVVYRRHHCIVVMPCAMMTGPIQRFWNARVSSPAPRQSCFSSSKMFCTQYAVTLRNRSGSLQGSTRFCGGTVIAWRHRAASRVIPFTKFVETTATGVQPADELISQALVFFDEGGVHQAWQKAITIMSFASNADGAASR